MRSLANLLASRQAPPGGLCAANGCGRPFVHLGGGEPGPLADPAAPHKLIAPALRPRRPSTRVRVIRGIPSAGPNRRRRRWRAAAVALAAVIVIVGAATARLFVWPPRGMPAHVDAIVMLNGQGNRLDTALWLAWNHRTPTVVISRGSPQWGHGSVCAPTIPGVKFICFVPNPETTRGEAEFAGELAKRHRWHSIALVTTTPQNTRARLRVGRCFSGKIYVVDAALPKYEWPYEIAYEWGATIKALPPAQAQATQARLQSEGGSVGARAYGWSHVRRAGRGRRPERP